MHSVINTMKEREILQTPMADVYLQDGILFMTVTNPNITLDDAKRHLQLVKEAFQDIAPWPSMIEGTMRANVSKEARDFLGGDEVTAVTRCGALLVESTVARIGGNLFLQFFKPKYPTKIFTDKEKALEWIRQH